MDLKQTKANVRMAVLAERKRLEAAETDRRSAAIRQQLTLLLAQGGFASLWQQGQVVALYTSVRGEANIEALGSWFRQHGLVTVFPKVIGPGKMSFVRVDDGTLWLTGAFGISEPVTGETIPPSAIDCMLLPGVAYDGAGYRIGYGGGYYDRVLAEGVSGVCIGVCYSFQLMNTLPREAHDRPVDFVVTESEWHNCCLCRGNGG